MKIILKRISFFMCLVLLISSFFACMPMYRSATKEEGAEGMTMEIDGLIYQSIWFTDWELLQPYNKIGYVDNYKTHVYESAKFSKRLFVKVENISREVYPALFYQNGIDLPEFSLEAVDSIEWIGWRELENRESEDFEYGERAVFDKVLISDLFKVITDETRVVDKDYNQEKYYGVIYFYNEVLTGLGYLLYIYGIGEEFWTYRHFFDDGTVSRIIIPIELIEQIAGGQIEEGKLRSE